MQSLFNDVGAFAIFTILNGLFLILVFYVLR